jgi:mRNA-degrading endonuclease RelE of RelBE toxin-antitoxin system
LPPLTQQGAPYRPVFTRQFYKALERLPGNDQKAILNAVQVMCESGTGSVLPLKKSRDLIAQYRLRVGSYRLFFDVDTVEEMVEVKKNGKTVKEKRAVNIVVVGAVERRTGNTY